LIEPSTSGNGAEAQFLITQYEKGITTFTPINRHRDAVPGHSQGNASSCTHWCGYYLDSTVV
jgi:hypothetical protein